MPNYATPGVFVEEITKFPPSVAQVPTAIPAFMGRTEKTLDNLGNSLVNKAIRIGSQKEYEQKFGFGPQPVISQINLDADNNFVSAVIGASNRHYLYDAIRLFYANGGGDCYIVSVGDYDDTVSDTAYTGVGAALEVVAKIDEPTILLFPDAANLAANLLSNVQKAALLQCGLLKDRVAIFDTRSDDYNGATFRTNIGINDLKYGAAYTPWLSTALPKNISYANLRGAIISKNGGPLVTLNNTSIHGGNPDIVAILNLYNAHLNWRAEYATYIAAGAPNEANLDAAFTALDALVTAPVATVAAKAPYTAAQNAYQAAQNATTKAALENTFATLNNLITQIYGGEQGLMDSFGVYKAIIAGINATPVEVPPSGAVAGIYAYVDRTRGVWKAPANVSLNGVVGPTAAFSSSELDALNIDVNAGKSINAIRTFTGKGTLVWGARTLAGNDNEWRYVPVRRFYNMVEESIKKACEQFVFEPNDANTWVRVQAMIENFLLLQWRDGALQGAKPEHAFFVSVGLGKTMTAQDILEGRMIVEIGMAPVRPAEFIILRFSQKMAES